MCNVELGYVKSIGDHVKTKDELLLLLRSWLDAGSGITYVHHDSDTTATVDGPIDLGALADVLLDAFNAEQASRQAGR